MLTIDIIPHLHQSREPERGWGVGGGRGRAGRRGSRY